jgi:hypothetical protein
MRQMLSYRTVLLAQTGKCSGIPPMALRSTPHQSLASSKSAWMTSSPQWLYVHTPTMDRQHPHWARAAAFKERDSNVEAYTKSHYALRQTIKHAKCQYMTKIILHRLWCLSDVAGLANHYRLQREAEPRAAQWHKPTSWAKLLLCSLRGK